jgi:hypothetical protein
VRVLGSGSTLQPLLAFRTFGGAVGIADLCRGSSAIIQTAAPVRAPVEPPVIPLPPPPLTPRSPLPGPLTRLYLYS